MKNVTITMDDDTAQWARVEAARLGLSLSRYVGELLALERHRPKAKTQLETLEQVLALGPLTPVASMPNREVIHAERIDELVRRHKHSHLSD